MARRSHDRSGPAGSPIMWPPPDCWINDFHKVRTLERVGGMSMDVQQIRKLKPRLRQFLKRFDDCFPRKDTRAHLPVYVSGQLSDIPEKSVEPIAINAGVPVRTLQEFLSQHAWDHDKARDRLQHIVRDEHAGPHSIGI